MEDPAPHLLHLATCRLREEVKEQIRALEELKQMAASYG
jgi:pyruvate-formate lyase